MDRDRSQSSVEPASIAERALEESVKRFGDAVAAKKCWSCGCLHGSLSAVERAFGGQPMPTPLARVLDDARGRLLDVRYDCLACEVCHPARALDALSRVLGTRGEDAGVCPSERAEARDGWPPLAGDYTVLQYRASVAICALTSGALAATIADQAPEGLALVGTLQTENLGIERLVTNVVANPHIRFLIVAGAESRNVVGHLPGQSLLALAGSGVDDHGRIIGARGKRPFLRNIGRDMIEHFRRNVEVADLVGQDDLRTILAAANACAERHVGPADAFAALSVVTPVSGFLPERMRSDPAGYLILCVDRAHRVLSVEHYRNEGYLDTVVEGRTAAEVYTTVIERGLVSRLDHAAYLGRELARAEHALASGIRYVQDAAPDRGLDSDRPAPACGPS